MMEMKQEELHVPCGPGLLRWRQSPSSKSSSFPVASWSIESLAKTSHMAFFVTFMFSGVLLTMRVS